MNGEPQKATQIPCWVGTPLIQEFQPFLMVQVHWRKFQLCFCTCVPSLNGIQQLSQLTYPKICCVAEARHDHFYSSGYALVTTSNFAHKSDGDPALPLYFSTDMVSTYSTSASKAQIKSRSIGLRRAMCFQQGPGHPGPWRTCGRRRSILSMALLSSTLQAGTNTDQINYYVWLQGEVCYYGRSTEFTLELRFQPLDHPGDLTQILEAHLLCLLRIVFSEKFHPQASLWWRSPSA